MPRERKGVTANVLAFVSQARAAASRALQSLRGEIAATRKRLAALIEAERSFRADLFGGIRGPRRVGRPRKVGRPIGSRTAAKRAHPRRKGPPKADTYFKKLPAKFTIDDVRRLAGKASAISLAQWTRSKRVKKTGDGYQKVA